MLRVNKKTERHLHENISMLEVKIRGLQAMKQSAVGQMRILTTKISQNSKHSRDNDSESKHANAKRYSVEQNDRHQEHFNLVKASRYLVHKILKDKRDENLQYLSKECRFERKIMRNKLKEDNDKELQRKQVQVEQANSQRVTNMYMQEIAHKNKIKRIKDRATMEYPTDPKLINELEVLKECYDAEQKRLSLVLAGKTKLEEDLKRVTYLPRSNITEISNRSTRPSESDRRTKNFRLKSRFTSTDDKINSIANRNTYTRSKITESRFKSTEKAATESTDRKSLPNVKLNESDKKKIFDLLSAQANSNLINTIIHSKNDEEKEDHDGLTHTHNHIYIQDTFDHRSSTASIIEHIEGQERCPSLIREDTSLPEPENTNNIQYH